jgi:LuxR family maltose regulon positive regulatory protein
VRQRGKRQDDSGDQLGARPGDGSCVPMLIEALRSVQPVELAIVLDDYHLIEARSCHEFIQTLVAGLPRGARLLITSRAPPPLDFGVIQPVTFDADALAFDLSEAAQLLNGSSQLGFDRTQLQAVQAALAGWPVGLSLLAVSAQAGGDSPTREVLDTLDLLAEREAADYLQEEVLDDLPADEARLLLETSVLARLSAPLCETVLDDPGAGRLLARLHVGVRFMVKDAEGWLRVHDLVRDSLATLLARRSPERVAALNARASDWFEREGRPVQALEHAIAAGDGPRAGRLLKDNSERWLNDHEWPMLRGALTRIPDPGPESAWMLEAVDLFLRHAEGVDLRLLVPRARELMEKHPDDAAMETMLVPIYSNQFTGDVGGALTMMREHRDDPRFMTAVGPGLTSNLWSAGELDAAQAAAVRYLEPGPSVQVAQSIFAHATTSRVWADRGDAERAEYHARRAVAPIIESGTECLSAWGSIWVCLGEALRLAGKLEEARVHQDFGMRMEEARPGAVGLGRALISEAQLALAERRRDLARTSARRAREILDSYPDPGAQLYKRLDAVEAQLAAPASDPLPGSVPTGAELRILRMLAEGASPRQVAEQLYVSNDTVKSHLRRLYRRVGATSREQAVAVARDRGLLR